MTPTDSLFASLDLGSNTVRLLIAERDPDQGFRPLRIERRITRLGGRFSLSGHLHPDSQKRTLEALQEFAALLKKEGVVRVFAAATGVIREARNGKDFLARIQEQTGIPPRLLTGEEEGELMLRGVLWGVPKGIPVGMAVDIGGWSTEVLWIEDGKIRKTRSAPLGAVSLCENFLKSDPPSLAEIHSLAQYLREAAAEFFHEFEESGWRNDGQTPLVGTAGTLTTLAAIDLKLDGYDSQKVTGHRISRRTLEQLFSSLASLTKEKRRQVPGLEEGREDLILSGTQIVLRLMECLRFESLVVVDSGLLEGVLLDALRTSSSSLRIDSRR
ncbi:MAG: Ppx/GppA phosphatase family protein [Deltaproteobacteria bacterium]|nr:Ppx/GppA phosphatase family protein [Deltaproteobacteria bacterium]